MLSKRSGKNKSMPDTLYIDAANGVGASKLKTIMSKINSNFAINIEIFNKGEGILNEGCGADFVKMYQKAPLYSPQHEHLENAHFCSLDGVADRLDYYFYDKELKFRLRDGDRLSALYCYYLKYISEASNFECTIGVVQTAYANGSSTRFFTQKLVIGPSIFNY